MEDLQPLVSGILTVLGGVGLFVLRWAVQQVRGVRATIADELVRSLARQMRPDTPDPAAHAAEPTDAGRVLGDLSRRVGVEVGSALAPIGRRLSRLEQQVRGIENDICVLLDHDAEAEQRTAEHSGRLGAVESMVTGAIDDTLGESIEEL